MERKESLTNEKIGKRFISQFELVNYAIKLAANMITTGRDCRVKMDSQNRAMQVIGEIYYEKDHFDEIIPPSPDEDEEQRRYPQEEESDAPSAKTKERKRARKILLD